MRSQAVTWLPHDIVKAKKKIQEKNRTDLWAIDRSVVINLLFLVQFHASEVLNPL